MRIALLTLLLGGCFKPAFDDGKTPCSTSDDCPPSTHCAVDNTCWHDGRDPSIDMNAAAPDIGEQVDGALDLLMPDLTGVDLQEPVKQQGQQCTPTDTCASGTQCVDGYCCNSACTGACKACNVQGFLGICSPVGAGSMPVGMRTCNGQGSTTCKLDGKCDGNGNCRYWAPGTNCAPGTCSAGNFVNPSTCDGAGNCTTGSSGSCGAYICQDATQCYTELHG